MAYHDNKAKQTSTQTLADKVLDVLLDKGHLTGRMRGARWQPATFALADLVWPDEEPVVSRSSSASSGSSAYNRYFQLMETLALLEELELVTIGREASGEFNKISLT